MNRYWHWKGTYVERNSDVLRFAPYRERYLSGDRVRSRDTPWNQANIPRRLMLRYLYRVRDATVFLSSPSHVLKLTVHSRWMPLEKSVCTNDVVDDVLHLQLKQDWDNTPR